MRQTLRLLSREQGILSVPGIAGYEGVPSRIGHFYKDKYFFHNTNGQLKTGKNRYSFNSRHFPCSVFPLESNALLCQKNCKGIHSVPRFVALLTMRAISTRACKYRRAHTCIGFYSIWVVF